jgi:hypothetical protein
MGVLIGLILGLAALSLYSCFRSDSDEEPSGYGIDGASMRFQSG